jgi:hypothetical protein
LVILRLPRRPSARRLDGLGLARRAWRRVLRLGLALGHGNPHGRGPLGLADRLADVTHGWREMVCQPKTGHAARMSEEPVEPESGDIREDITRELARLFPDDRMQRIGDRLGLFGDDDFQFVIDLISATFTRGIEFGAIEVAAQQIEAGSEISPVVEIAHVDLP